MNEIITGTRISAIDIGTNTILMVIAEINKNKGLHLIRDEHAIARLGESVDKTKFINYDALNRAKEILDKYKNLCDGLNVKFFAIAGTAALREATNRDEICDELSNMIGHKIEVISGEEEARLSFIGTVEDTEPSFVIDIGGGSTEIIFGINNEIKVRHSLPIGAVKITERFFKTLPPTKIEIERAINEIHKNLSKIKTKFNYSKVYGVAGTPTTLAAHALGLQKYDDSKVHNYIMSYETISKIYDKLLFSSKQDILKLPGIHPGRADIITAGTMILHEIYIYFELKSIIVSTYGLRYGILKNLYDILIS